MNINSVENCSGCLLCKEVCPKKCISIQKDKLGHMHPSINAELCIDCGMCAKQCPEMSPIALHEIIDVYAGWDINTVSREKSSSGGVATLISQQFINDGGVVYGSAFVPPFRFEHVRCSDIKSLERLRGSKYVQSDTSNCWGQLQTDLKNGLKVLFIGTPCQVAAAKRIFKNTDNLYTIDLICHGVPSVEILERSLPRGLKKEDIASITFRDSTRYTFKAINKENKIIYSRPLTRNWYMKGFFTSLYCRNSCYNCKYAKEKRAGNITLGDFWGIQEDNFAEEEKKGISAIIINSEKGKTLLTTIKGTMYLIKRNINEVRKNNKPLNRSSKKSFRYRIFKSFVNIIGVNNAIKLSLPEIATKSLIKRILRKKQEI